MSQSDDIRAELDRLLEDARLIRKAIGDSRKLERFSKQYQSWYSRALRVVSLLAPDRIGEFRSYYERDQKHPSTAARYYRIQDYVMGFEPPHDIYGNPDWDVPNHVALVFQSQVNILSSVSTRIEGVLANITATALAGIHDQELASAAFLNKQSPRAAGALPGVVLESHLQTVAANHSIPLRRARPTVADLNDPLRDAGIYDTAVWRKIQYLADIRNLCSHKKAKEPTQSEVAEMIAGVNWVLKNIS